MNAPIRQGRHSGWGAAGLAGKGYFRNGAGGWACRGCCVALGDLSEAFRWLCKDPVEESRTRERTDTAGVDVVAGAEWT